MDGITLGSGSAIGEAFEAWQRYVKGLGERGIILAVCSKNSPEIAETGFAHRNTVLRLQDFAALECSWSDKVQGLRRIAQVLNLDLNCFVFADDNPAECDLIQRELPDVAAIPLGSDPAAFIELLDAGRWFDMQRYTSEDLGRTQSYAARRQALDVRSQVSDLGTYLTDLKMIGTFSPLDEADIAHLPAPSLRST